jgi:hypothetical protein
MSGNLSLQLTGWSVARRANRVLVPVASRLRIGAMMIALGRRARARVAAASLYRVVKVR